MLLKTNSGYGVKIGNKMAFTKEGALNIYKVFLQVCYPLTIESSVILSNVENDLINKAGFTWDEISNIENNFIETI